MFYASTVMTEWALSSKNLVERRTISLPRFVRENNGCFGLGLR